MKKVFTVLTILVSLLFASKQVSASHLMGADISYTCLGSNQYQITLSLYRDCSGITLGTTALINYNSASTGLSGSATLNQVGTTTEVTPVCPAMLTQTTCSGGLLPGVQQYVYQGVITLPGQATDWIIDYNKLGPPNLSGQYDFYYQGENLGVDKTGEILDVSEMYGIVEKGGAWYTVEGERLQGRAKAVQYLRDNKEILNILMEKINEK